MIRPTTLSEVLTARDRATAIASCLAIPAWGLIGIAAAVSNRWHMAAYLAAGVVLLAARYYVVVRRVQPMQEALWALVAGIERGMRRAARRAEQERNPLMPTEPCDELDP